MPTSAIAVSQSINTLTHGDVLKVSSCNKNNVAALIHFCINRGNTLLDRKTINDEITLFFKKN
jgi:TusA-related sulfurtransferase